MPSRRLESSEEDALKQQEAEKPGYAETESLKAKDKASERPSPRDVLAESDVDGRAFKDKEGRTMETRLDAAYNGQAQYDSDKCFFGLYDGKTKAGELCMSLDHEPLHPDQPGEALKYTNARINSIRVEAEYQGAGSGAELLKVAESTGRVYGAEQLTCSPQDTKAIDFLQANGWDYDSEGGTNQLTRSLKPDATIKWRQYQEEKDAINSETGEDEKRIDVFTSNNLLGLRNDANGEFRDTGHGHTLMGHQGTQESTKIYHERPETNDGTRAQPTIETDVYLNIKKL